MMKYTSRKENLEGMGIKMTVEARAVTTGTSIEAVEAIRTRKVETATMIVLRLSGTINDQQQNDGSTMSREPPRVPHAQHPQRRFIPYTLVCIHQLLQRIVEIAATTVCPCSSGNISLIDASWRQELWLWRRGELRKKCWGGFRTYYREVFSFTTCLRVAAQTRDPAVIRQDIGLCLKGSANIWWAMELDDVTRYGLYSSPCQQSHIAWLGSACLRSAAAIAPKHIAGAGAPC